jgi:capsular polysaccharide biosynthesis protein
MTLNGLFAGIGRRWVVITAFALIGAVAALVLNAVLLPQYKADARVYVAVSSAGALSTSDRVAANSAAAQATVTFVALGTSDTVLQGVLDGLGIDETIEDFRKRVAVLSEPESVVITISGTDPSPEQAATIANAVAAQLDATVRANDPSTAANGAAVPQVQLQVLSQAIPPELPITGGILVLLALGILGGAVVGVGVAIVMTALDRRVRSGDDVRASIDRPLLGIVPAKAAKLDELLNTTDIPARYSAVAFELAAIARSRSFSSFAVAPSSANTPHVASAVLLAKALAVLGSTVVVVDGTAEGSALASASAGRPGLREVLSGSASLDEAIIKRSTDRVDLLPAGNAQAGTPMAADRLHSLVEELEKVYDIVLVIAGTLGATEQSVAFRGVADGAVVVLIEGKVDGQQAAADVHWIETAGTPVVGAVLLARHKLQKAPAIV